MIILSATTDSLEAITNGTSANVDMHCSWNDYDGTSTFVPGRTNSAAVAGAPTTTTLLAAPASGHYRNAKTINIRNKHATNPVTVTVQFNQNTTLIELHKVVLNSGEALEYVEGVGFFVLGQANPNLIQTLSSDQSNSTTTPTELTGLTMALVTGTYTFDYMLIVQTSVTTTAVKFSVNFTGTVTRFAYWYYGLTTLATAADGAIDQTVSTTTGGLFCVNGDRAKSTAGLTAFVSIDTINADTLFKVEGTMVVTVAGSLALWHGSETAAATTVMAGSNLTVCRTGN